MEKRKTNILNQLTAIQEEKNTAIDNLKILLLQVTSCAQRAQASADNSKVLEILSYELDILKKLTEINLELENLAESCPIEFQAIANEEEPSNCGNGITEDIQSSEDFIEELNISPNPSKLDIESNIDNKKKSKYDFPVNGTDTIHDLPELISPNSHELAPESYYRNQSEFDFSDVIDSIHNAADSIEPVTFCYNQDLLEPTMFDINDEVPVRDVDQECRRQNTNSAMIKLTNYAANKKQLAVANNDNSKTIPYIKLEPVDKNKSDIPEPMKKKKNKKKNKGSSSNLATVELRRKKMPRVNDYCYFSHIESPAEFYIHVVDEETILIDKLEADMNKYFKNSLCPYDMKEMAYNLIRDFGCVYAPSYKRWYRCKIVDWRLNEKTDLVVLQFVDHGNVQLTTYTNLRRMPKEFAKLPMLAIRCFFPLLYPPGSTHLNRKTEWPPESIDALANLSLLFEKTQINMPFKIEYACENIENNTLAVDLFSPTNPDQTIGEILLDLRFVEQLPEMIEESNLEVEVFTQDINMLENALNVNEVVLGYDPKDEARICRFSRKDGTCFKGKNCKLEHRQLPKDGFTTDQEDVFNEAMYDLVLPLIDEIVLILITGHRDVCNFYAQIIRTTYCDPNNLYKMDLSMHNLLTEMNSENSIRQYESFRIMPSLGELVIVYNYWSKQWLRAVFTGLIDEEQDFATVFTVDFGETIKVKLTDVRKMKERFLKLPFQAVLCYIGGYKQNTRCHNKDATDFFFKNMYCRNFVAVIMSSDQPVRIKLQTYNDTDIGNRLLNMGYVERVSRDTHIPDNSILWPC